ncbi:MAG TPA: CoA-transferase [Candidatus Binataceae bacterium]|nr:CoA-transferase [Candidatus Binataceae bacterium]
MDTTYTVQELMAVVLARELNDGEVLRVGVASPVPEAAVRLAHLMHGPNMELVFLGARMNVAHLASVPMPAYGWDRRVVRWAESYSDTGHRFDRVKDWSNHVFFIGGVQVDAYGNTNLIGIGEDYRRLRFRGPGSVGTPTLSTHVGRYYIVLNNHTPRVLVERCDYVSAFGWGRGGADARRKLGLPGGGPRLCVTPLCVMDFAEESRRMRLRSLHPGVTLEAVKAATGFELVIPSAVATTAAPSAAELEALRTRVDIEGRLRR